MKKRTISTVLILASVIIAVISLHYLLDDVNDETKKTLNNRATSSISVTNPHNFESMQFRAIGERNYYVITHMDSGNITVGLLSIGSTSHLLKHISLEYNRGWEVHVSGYMNEVFNEMDEATFDTYMSYLNVIMAIVIMRYQETIEENSTEHLHYQKI